VGAEQDVCLSEGQDGDTVDEGRGLSSVNLDRSWVLTLQIPLSRQILSVKGSATPFVISESLEAPLLG
jgi:hypothetical protein